VESFHNGGGGGDDDHHHDKPSGSIKEGKFFKELINLGLRNSAL
jgi:hypothetical protein